MKNMKQKFFLKNLLVFLVPLSVSVLILGTLSVYVTQKYVEGEVRRNNLNLFFQIEKTTELIFNEMEFLSISLGGVDVLYQLDKIFYTRTLTLENLYLIENIKNYINAPANARPYIESVYVYINNPHGQFLTSLYGLTRFDQFHDLGWLESYQNNQDNRKIRIESRTVQRYRFEQPVRVTTFYKNLYSPLNEKSAGVIVLNIYTEYIERQLKAIAMYPDQHILILNQGEVIFGTRPISLSPEHSARETFTLRDHETEYIAVRQSSENREWDYVILTPKKAMNQIPSRLGMITLSAVLAAFAAGLLLTAYFTGKNVNHIRNIISIIKSAENNQPLPRLGSVKNDEYGFIIQNIVKNFIEQHYLKTQLNEKKYRLQVLELKSLQSQLNPHFLFNTLETIYWKAVRLTGQPNEVNQMLEYLSDLLKYSLDQADRVVPFGKEINHTMNYINIQKIRYHNKFDVIWEYDEKILQCGVLKLLLQPIVENAIYHGIQEREGKGRIKIKIMRLNDTIRITVIDNGKGMSPQELRHARSLLDRETEPEKHIGLYNTCKRLKLTFGDRCEFRIRSKPWWGTVVHMEYPC